MRIEQYSFGKIIIDGKKYSSDLLITPDQQLIKWWRESSHNLILPDLEEIFKDNPQTIIIGTGFYGLMKVSKAVKQYCRSHNIKLIISKTKHSIEKYNSLASPQTAAAFHLTC